MTLDVFTKEILGDDAHKYSQKEIEVYFNMSVNLFNTMFDKWKREKFTTAEVKR